MTEGTMLILTAGAFRPGTGDDLDLMSANVARLEVAAWSMFAAGHISKTGGWVARRVLRGTGATTVLDPTAEQLCIPRPSASSNTTPPRTGYRGTRGEPIRTSPIARPRALSLYVSHDEVPQSKVADQ